jgi:putative membrane protein
MKKRTPLQLALLSLKGMAMGAADVVPGVSGGTIAFVSGIYDELINGINAINIQAFTALRKEGFSAFWKHINGTFFLFLFLGIGTSILSLSKLVIYLLENHPVVVWSFFFGLIIASTWLIAKTIKTWNFSTIVFLSIGTAIAYWISSMQTTAHVDQNWYIFLSGFIAICAMILPGISGSFILVLMGSYHLILSALHNRDLLRISLFAAGCLIGILSFARLLKFLFTKYKEITISLLTGFMIGSLYKVWPWKIKIGLQPLVVHSNGKEDWMMANVLPANFPGDNQIIASVLALLSGFFLIYVLEKFAPKGK